MVKLIKGVNDLATLRPDLAAQWHPTKNGDLKPTDVTQYSGKKVWWICAKGHEWESTISNRSVGKGCPICSGLKVLSGVTDLATVNPKLASEWHPTKNGDLKPTTVLPFSNVKAWWICPKGHEWQSTINNRSKGSGCPICSSELRTSFPEQAIYYYLKQLDNSVENRKKINNKWEVDVWIPSKNIAIEYDGCRYHNGKKSKQKEQKKNDYLKTCGIRLIRVRESLDKNVEVGFDNDILTFSVKNNYIYLKIVIKELCKLIFDDIRLIIDINMDKTTILESYKQDCLNNSLATLQPELALQWHPTKNGTLTPYMFTQWSNEKAWWICPLGHEWQDTISHRSGGRGCPVCANKQVLKGFNDLATLRPDLALQWHPTKNGKWTPQTVTQSSGKKAWWICPLGHEWEARIADRSNGNGCPICSGRQVLVGYNDLSTTYPELAKQWHPTKNGTNTPQMFSKGSNEKAWWISPCGREWEAKICSRTGGRKLPNIRRT